jgi:hypothetical protein
MEAYLDMHKYATAKEVCLDHRLPWLGMAIEFQPA